MRIAKIDHGGMTVDRARFRAALDAGHVGFDLAGVDPVVTARFREALEAGRLRRMSAVRLRAVFAAILGPREPALDPGPINNRHARRKAAALDRKRRRLLQRLASLATAVVLGTAVGCGPAPDAAPDVPDAAYAGGGINPVWIAVFPDDPALWTLP